MRREKKINQYFLNLEAHKKAKSSVRNVFNNEGSQKNLQENQNFHSILCKRDPLSPSEDMLKLVFKSFWNTELNSGMMTLEFVMEN